MPQRVLFNRELQDGLIALVHELQVLIVRGEIKQRQESPDIENRFKARAQLT